MPTRAEAIARLTAPGEPFELVLVEQYGVPCRAFANAPTTLGALFEETRSDATFLVYDDERYSYDETFRRASAIAAALRTELGVAKGDRVAISMRNYPEWIVAFEAVTSIGGIAVAMNALWEPEEMEYALRDCGARALFADLERLDRLAGCSESLETELELEVISVRATRKPEGAVDFEELLARHADAPMPGAEVDPTDDAIILYTSGSTGQPKGAVSCHRNVLSALLSWELDVQANLIVNGLEAPQLGHQVATLLAVPLFHATGSHAVYLNSYRAQRKIVSMYKWDPEQAAELIEREKITSVIAPAAMTGDLVETAKRTRRDLSTLLSVGGGGAPRAPEQVRRIAESFANAAPGTGWGMTESNAIGTGITAQDYLDRPASSGRCSAVLDLRIVDAGGNELPSGERGELQVRGTSIFRGYWNRPEATAEAFADGRWLRTGDVAYVDDDGFLFIVDRIKDLVIRGGENVGCGEVEAALVEHPHVLEAAVYAVPDERLGEEVGATVYCDAPIDEAELRAFLAGHLARFKIPKYFDIRTTPLPRIASGKIFKRKIRQDAVERLGLTR
ncbi:MAG TPA: class I adenylate-forming enzyme family protein [Thermoanaerobaculia bacterium]|nr:class I adenylate-forming enzyme family protein [Thermoanaerobaculia bacterium]